MVNKRNNDKHQEEIEITNDGTENIEPDLEEVEEDTHNLISTMRSKLKVAEAEKKSIQEENQRNRADFLNARKRLEDDRKRDKDRSIIEHTKNLIPICDSFELAMGNGTEWQKTDEVWRKGIEGIYAQFNSLLDSYNVVTINPIGRTFDPHQHEAISTELVNDKERHDTITKVVQKGYEVKKNDETSELIRPARVIIGVYEKQ